MATTRINLYHDRYTEVSSKTGSIFLEKGDTISLTEQVSLPAIDAPVMDIIRNQESKVIKVNSGEKLYAKSGRQEKCSVTFS